MFLDSSDAFNSVAPYAASKMKCTFLKSSVYWEGTLKRKKYSRHLRVSNWITKQSFIVKYHFYADISLPALNHSQDIQLLFPVKGSKQKQKAVPVNLHKRLYPLNESRFLKTFGEDLRVNQQESSAWNKKLYCKCHMYDNFEKISS